jgi:hypothetical protein
LDVQGKQTNTVPGISKESGYWSGSCCYWFLGLFIPSRFCTLIAMSTDLSWKRPPRHNVHFNMGFKVMLWCGYNTTRTHTTATEIFKLLKDCMLIADWSHYGNTLQKQQHSHADDVFDAMLTLADGLMPTTQGWKVRKRRF